MDNDLFQIAKARDIYLTLDLWTMLSPRLSGAVYRKLRPSEGSHESEKQSSKNNIEHLASARPHSSGVTGTDSAGEEGILDVD